MGFPRDCPRLRRGLLQMGCFNVHVVLKHFEVSLLLSELLLELQELFLLTLADRIVLVGLLTLLEGVTSDLN